MTHEVALPHTRRSAARPRPRARHLGGDRRRRADRPQPHPGRSCDGPRHRTPLPGPDSLGAARQIAFALVVTGAEDTGSIEWAISNSAQDQGAQLPQIPKNAKILETIPLLVKR
ncbi:hypothetical protein [Winogradskya humida]|uniref:hypothetical protein n=1 Tax=Winogradskya humida TaxID=113566 RepID=UPI00194199E7|nr:hypothetical protein [Actinoplanes humidus]